MGAGVRAGWVVRHQVLRASGRAVGVADSVVGYGAGDRQPGRTGGRGAVGIAARRGCGLPGPRASTSTAGSIECRSCPGPGSRACMCRFRCRWGMCRSFCGRRSGRVGRCVWCRRRVRSGPTVPTSRWSRVIGAGRRGSRSMRSSTYSPTARTGCEPTTRWRSVARLRFDFTTYSCGIEFGVRALPAAPIRLSTSTIMVSVRAGT